MKVYMYQATLLCEECGEKIREALLGGSCRRGQAYPCDDSERWPQGPYPDGGGEADCPQRCDHCRLFLENPLTSDGEEYVRQQWRNYHAPPRQRRMEEWREFYAYPWRNE